MQALIVTIEGHTSSELREDDTVASLRRRSRMLRRAAVPPPALSLVRDPALDLVAAAHVANGEEIV